MKGLDFREETDSFYKKLHNLKGNHYFILGQHQRSGANLTPFSADNGFPVWEIEYKIFRVSFNLLYTMFLGKDTSHI